MHVDTKFNIDDKVYVYDTKLISVSEEKCNICDGTGKVKLKNQLFNCPNCKNGIIKSKDHAIVIFIKKITVINIIIFVNYSNPRIYYKGIDKEEYDEDIVFASYNEILKHAEKLVHQHKNAPYQFVIKDGGNNDRSKT